MKKKITKIINNNIVLMNDIKRKISIEPLYVGVITM